MLMFDRPLPQTQPSTSSEALEILATDWVRYHHHTLQAAVRSNNDQAIGRALDALGVAYGVCFEYEKMLQYCAIAHDILQEADDPSGAELAHQHAQTAAQRIHPHPPSLTAHTHPMFATRQGDWS